MAAVQHNFLTGLKEYALITAGVLCYALAWIIFLIPNNLVGGGVTGVASIVQYATGGVIKVSYGYFVINAILLIIGMSSLGKGFGAKTVYAVIAASLAFNFGGDLIPHEIIRSLALDNGKLMCVIMGGMLSGFGIGLTMSQGGSTSGTDIVALVLNKRRGISPGRMILWLDIVIIASSIRATWITFGLSAMKIPFSGSSLLRSCASVRTPKISTPGSLSECMRMMDIVLVFVLSQTNERCKFTKKYAMMAHHEA